MTNPLTKAGLTLLDDPDDGYPWSDPNMDQPEREWREQFAAKIVAVERDAIDHALTLVEGRDSVISAWARDWIETEYEGFNPATGEPNA